jgi:hypothetical protein
MAETAAHLVDHVISRVPVRQWVLSFPIPLRFLLAAHPPLLSPILQVTHRAISTFLIQPAGLNRAQAATGAVTLIQRFGSAANWNSHLHCLYLDGVYDTTGKTPVFHPVRSPTAEQGQSLLHTIIKRILKLLIRTGHLVEEQETLFMAENPDETDTAMAPLQSAACPYRIALGPRTGQKVLTLQTVPGIEVPSPSQRCANEQGFSLHAEVRCAMNQRNKLERLCRYITRPAIANERLSINNNGDVVLQLKSLHKDGTTHIVLSPLEIIAGSDFEQPRVGPKGGGQDARSNSCNAWPPWCRAPGSISSDSTAYSHRTPNCVPRSFRRLRKPLQVARIIQTLRLLDPHPPASAGLSDSNGCSISMSLTVPTAVAP